MKYESAWPGPGAPKPIRAGRPGLAGLDIALMSPAGRFHSPALRLRAQDQGTRRGVSHRNDLLGQPKCHLGGRAEVAMGWGSKYLAPSG